MDDFSVKISFIMKVMTQTLRLQQHQLHFDRLNADI